MLTFGFLLDRTQLSQILNAAHNLTEAIHKLAATGEKFMAAFDTLNQNLTNLSNDISANSTAMSQLGTDFTAAIAALQAAVSNGDTAAIAAAADQVAALDTQVQGVLATANAMDETAKGLIVPPVGPQSSARK